MRAGLRIDVDTHDGMTEGIPRLLEILRARDIRATFYVAMGPDNSGRAVLGALFRRGFLRKMLRTRAVSTYGWRTILSGTLLPARPIGHSRGDLMRAILDAGHELGPHSWDHRRWQDRLDRLPPRAVEADLDAAFEAMRTATGSDAVTCAAPAWLSSEASLLHEETLGLSFASDCRGRSPFYPRFGGRDLATLQIPATMPTLDEALGRTCRKPADYYRMITFMLDGTDDRHDVAAYHVLTVHAETEGRRQAEDFGRFLDETSPRHRWVPLGEFAADARGASLRCYMTREAVPGRHGQVSMQGDPVELGERAEPAGGGAEGAGG